LVFFFATNGTQVMPRAGTARDKILDAALRAIVTKGITATTVNDLCADAGVTKGAFFHHFDIAACDASMIGHAAKGGTAISKENGIPDVIPAEACYLGWRDSLHKLEKLAVPEIKQSIYGEPG
jgi:TetR/AcrR family transcriptional regulator, transcriptional repressor for nem operon